MQNWQAVSAVAMLHAAGATAAGSSDSDGIVPLCFHGEDAASLGILMLLFVLLASFFGMHMLSMCKIDTYVPESIATVLTGVIIGGVIQLLEKPFNLPDISKIFELNTHFFFLILLPAIIFDAGYHMHNQSFFANIGGITLLAVVGTVISTAVISSGLYLAGQHNLSFPLNLSESLAFGAVISAIDPVATLAIFQALNVNPTLHMLVFGESIVNDAVSITIYKTVMSMGDNITDVNALGRGVLSFLWVSIASVAVGTVHGLATSWAYKYVQLHKHINLEVGVYYLMAYIPYLVSDAMELSPIITVLVVGIFMSEYAHYNLSDAAKITVTNSFRVLAFMSETLVFAYLGLAVFNFPKAIHFDWQLTLWTLFLMVLGRAMNVFPLCFLLNLFRSSKISFKNQLVMWFSGLRGAIAFAMTIDAMGKDFSATGTDRLHVLFTTTLIICNFTIFFFGGGTLPVLKILRVETQEQKSGDVKEKRNAIQIAENAQSREDYQNQQNWMLWFDNNYMKPMFCVQGWDSAPYQPPIQEMAEGRNPTTPVAIDLVELADMRWGRGSMSVANLRDQRSRSSLRLSTRKSYVPSDRWHVRAFSPTQEEFGGDATERGSELTTFGVDDKLESLFKRSNVSESLLVDQESPKSPVPGNSTANNDDGLGPSTSST